LHQIHLGIDCPPEDERILRQFLNRIEALTFVFDEGNSVDTLVKQEDSRNPAVSFDVGDDIVLVLGNLNYGSNLRSVIQILVIL